MSIDYQSLTNIHAPHHWISVCITDSNNLNNTNFSFLPYTAKFEVNEPEAALTKDQQLLTESSLHAPQAHKPPHIDPTILPSLSKAAPDAPVANLAPPRSADTGNATPEQFFYGSRKSVDSLLASSTDALHEKSAPQLIQPKSRYHSNLVPSSVVEAKKKQDDVGLPALKISSRGSPASHLHSRSSRGSHSEFDPAGTPPFSRAAFRKYAANSNAASSSSSLVLADDDLDTHHLPASAPATAPATASEHPADAVRSPLENDVEYGEKHMAPYGGFSRPDLDDVFMDQKNVFENAPWQIVKTDVGNGSLYNAVNLAHEQKVLKNTRWVGALSLPTDVIPQDVFDKISKEMSTKHACEVVAVNDITFQGHYKSFCKQILWPTLHYQIPDDPKSKAFEEHSFHHYRLLNQLMADRIVEVYKRENAHLPANDPERVIWIHDYHLLLVPKMIREQLPEAKIGFFLHVSFPSSEVFRCLAQREALLEGMCAADCVTFQTDEYVRHFLQTCTRLLLADTNDEGVVRDGFFTKTNTIPVGIDARALDKVLAEKDVVEWLKLIRERWGDQLLLVSRDKFDKLRGIKQKLLAYELFLRENPAYINKAVLVQVLLGTTSNEDFRSEVMQIVSRINSMAGNISIAQPVVLLEKDIDFDQYLALQHEADVFIVSCMREGLNLTCHEFVEASSEKKSPLLLSEFTGSSQLLHCKGEGALLINPWDKREFSNMIKKALTMSKEEKEKRWNNCHQIVLKHDSMDWIKSCIAAINDAWRTDHLKTASVNKWLTKNDYEGFYASSEQKKLFVFNLDVSVNDGVYGDTSGKSFLSLSRSVALMTEIAAQPDNIVYVISVLKTTELELLFKNTPSIGLIAESGGFLRMIGSTKWISIVDEQDVKNWIPQAALLVRAMAERLPGSDAIVEECTVRWVADLSMKEDPKRCLSLMGDYIQHINEVYEASEHVHATLINNSVIVQQRNISLRAIRLLVTCYTSDVDADVLAKRYQVRRVASSTDEPGLIIKSPVTEKSGWLEEAVERPREVHRFFYSGGLTPIDEVIYGFVNNLEKDSSFENVMSVAVCGKQLHSRTLAAYSILGQNELFAILSRR